MGAYYGQTANAAQASAVHTNYNPMRCVGPEEAQDTPERDLEYIIARINECIYGARSSCERVADIANRVKGPVNQCGEKSGLASGGLGNIAEIHSLLDTLTNVLDDLGSNISRIENL